MFAERFADLAGLQGQLTGGDEEEGLDFVLVDVDLL